MKRATVMSRNLGRTLAATGVVAFLLAGCGRDARLADHELRDPAAKTVSYYGQRLDASADPRQVVYVLLQAVVEDYAAGEDQAAREKALDAEFDVCAAEYIKRRVASRADAQRQKEVLFEIVHQWAPILGFYRASFEGSYDALKERMYLAPVLQSASADERVSVYLNVDHPHPEEAGPNSGAVARFQLTRENGYWRIFWVGWDNGMRDWHTRFGRPEIEQPSAD